MYGFVHIEKTAGTTLNAILRRSFGTGHCDIRLPLSKRKYDHRKKRVPVTADDLRRVQLLYRNLNGIAGHNVKAYSDLNDACPGLRFVTVMRDPVARFKSHFLNRSRDNSQSAFDRWLASECNHNWQTKMIAGVPDARKAIDLINERFGFVGLTEQFDETVLLLGQWIGRPGFRPEYRSRNVMRTKHRPQDRQRARLDMSFLESDAGWARIAEANQEDQRVYDFVVQQVFPRQVAAYQGNLPADVDALRRRNESLRWNPEPILGILMRNYVYKPLLHCHVV